MDSGQGTQQGARGNGARTDLDSEDDDCGCRDMRGDRSEGRAEVQSNRPLGETGCETWGEDGAGRQKQGWEQGRGGHIRPLLGRVEVTDFPHKDASG